MAKGSLIKRSVFTVGHLLPTVLLLLGLLAPPVLVTAQSFPPSLGVDPDSGAQGTQALVTGSFPNCYHDDTVTLWWDTDDGGRRLGSTPFRADGTFALPIIIPPDAAPITHQVVAEASSCETQDEVDFEVTVAARRALYIFGREGSTPDEFKALLDKRGFKTDLVPVDEVADTRLTPYDIILVGDDTLGSFEWMGSPEARSNIQGSGKPVLGLGAGGAALFEELDLYIGYGHTWMTTDVTEVYAYQGEHPLWNEPFDIYLGRDKLVPIDEEGTIAWHVHLPERQPGVWPLGRQHDDADHFPIVQEDGRYVLWGFADGPVTMTDPGKDLLVNVLYYLTLAFSKDTLILTDYDRMEYLGYTAADVAALENDVNNLRGQPHTASNMRAIHRDLSDDAPDEVQSAYADWDGSEGSMEANNAYVEAIDGYTEGLKQGSYPNLTYVILVGTNEVIPMKGREQDHLTNAEVKEQDWALTLPEPIAYIQNLYFTRGANNWGHYLTDSVYGDLSYVADGWGTDHELVPELAVGRLVETPAQISGLIDTYLDGDATFALDNRVSIASQDFVDSGTLAAELMDPGADDILVQPGFDSNEVPPKLFSAHDLVYLGGHGNYNRITTVRNVDRFWAGNHESDGDTHGLGDMPDAVIVSSGCHNGVSFGNMLYEPPDASTTYSEFPEEFAARKVGVYIAATGYTLISASGDLTDVAEVLFNEKLSTYVIQHLDHDGQITAGEAFRRAINSYVSDVGYIDTAERRVISITTLYGIPNYRAPLMEVDWPRRTTAWLQPDWLDPMPTVEGGQFRFRIEYGADGGEIVTPGEGSDWYLKIPGATYSGGAGEPLMPVLKMGVILPPGSSCSSVRWDMSASHSTTWIADAPMYVPEVADVPPDVEASTSPGALRFEPDGLFPEEPYSLIMSTTTGGAGVRAGLRIVPLQHDAGSLGTRLWTRLAFDVACECPASTDADGDRLPAYWELSNRLDDNDAGGDQGAGGDPDGDGLPNHRELDEGTDPMDPDSDDDGWPDGKEVDLGTSPLNPGAYPRIVHLPLVLRNAPEARIRPEPARRNSARVKRRTACWGASGPSTHNVCCTASCSCR